jgi:hypothetical protein
VAVNANQPSYCLACSICTWNCSRVRLSPYAIICYRDYAKSFFQKFTGGIVMPTRGASQGSVPLHIDPHLSSPSFSLLWSVCKALQAFDQGQCVATCFRCEAGQTQTQHLFRLLGTQHTRLCGKLSAARLKVIGGSKAGPYEPFRSWGRSMISGHFGQFFSMFLLFTRDNDYIPTVWQN